MMSLLLQNIAKCKMQNARLITRKEMAALVFHFAICNLQFEIIGIGRSPKGISFI
jgi:hypothetical protein